MSREIKFRAYSFGKFIYINGAYDLKYWSCDGGQGPNRTLSEMKWEQFTGLKDCDGVDIYESDIVHHRKLGSANVAYNQRLCAFVLDTEYAEPLNSNFIRVIGNIHEQGE